MKKKFGAKRWKEKLDLSWGSRVPMGWVQTPVAGICIPPFQKAGGDTPAQPQTPWGVVGTCSLLPGRVQRKHGLAGRRLLTDPSRPEGWAPLASANSLTPTGRGQSIWQSSLKKSRGGTSLACSSSAIFSNRAASFSRAYCSSGLFHLSVRRRTGVPSREGGGYANNGNRWPVKDHLHFFFFCYSFFFFSSSSFPLFLQCHLGTGAFKTL